MLVIHSIPIQAPNLQKIYIYMQKKNPSCTLHNPCGKTHCIHLNFMETSVSTGSKPLNRNNYLDITCQIKYQ